MAQTRWLRGCLTALIASGLLALLPLAAQAQREDWALLGVREVDRGKGRESIDLRQAKGQVKAIRLIAKGGGLELTKVTVTYADGRVHDEARRMSMNPNDRTRPIDAGGTDRFVDTVDLVIQPERLAAGAPRTTLIEVWGLQSSAGAKAARPAPAAPAMAATPAPQPVPAPESTKPTAPTEAAAPPPPPPAARAATERSAPPPEPVRPASAGSAPPALTQAPPESTAEPARAQLPTPPPTQPPTQPPGLSQGTAPPLPPPRGADGRPDPRIALQQKKLTPPAPVPAGKAEKDSGEGIFLGRQPLAARDTDTVQIAVEGGRFARLRLRAVEAAARIERVSVEFTSGPAEEIPLGTDIPAGGGSAWIGVPGDRPIRHVSITSSRRASPRSTGTLELFGEYVPGYLDPGGEGARDPRHNGWVTLGASTTALRVGFDQIELPIADNKGGFKKLRVDVRDRAITLREVRVVYGTGEDEIIAIDSARQKISAGASFGPIDLRGGTRLVKRIVLKSRSRFLDSEARGRDAAIVEVWGQH